MEQTTLVTMSKRGKMLADYFKAGLEQAELCVIIMPETSGTLIDILQKNGLDIEPAVKNGAMRIFDMQDTYQQDGGKIVAKYMMHNIEGFIADAKAQGYKGLRIVSETSWIFDHMEVIPKPIQCKQSVDYLALKGADFSGIYLYPIQPAFSTRIHDVLTGDTYDTSGKPATKPNFGNA